VSSGKAIRSSVAIGWLFCAFLLERILTLGGITDTSQAGQNPPLFLAIGSALIVLGLVTAVAVGVGIGVWPSISMVASVAYIASGVWLRVASDDTSGIAIVVLAALIGIASGRALGKQRRRTRQNDPSS